jgi:hypothetical protein
VLAYLTEIISKQDWKEEYGEKVYGKIDKKFYRKSLAFIKSKIFTPANLSDKRYIFLHTDGGKLSKTNITKYVLDKNDTAFVNLINEHTKYKIPLNKIASFLTIGKVLDSKTITTITLAIADLRLKFMANEDDYRRQSTSREQTLKNKELQLDAEKDPKKRENLIKIIEGIKKRLKQDEENQKIAGAERVNELVDAYWKKFESITNKKYIIVLTYDTRAVASQSTAVSWRSCMNLDGGEYNQYVPKTINIGSFIAYLSTKKDIHELKDPIGRVLCKAYYGYDDDDKNPDIIWIAGNYYPSDKRGEMKWFGKAVQDFLNNNNKPKYRYYNQTEHNYADTSEPHRIDVVRDFGVDEDSVINNSIGAHTKDVQGIKTFRPESFSDLSEHEMEEVMDLAWEMANESFDVMDIDDRSNREEFAKQDKYIDDLMDKAREKAEKNVDRDNYDSDDEYEEAINDEIDGLGDAAWRDIYKDITDEHDRDYRNFLYDIFNSFPSNYIDSTDYIDEAFDEWVDKNY